MKIKIIAFVVSLLLASLPVAKAQTTIAGWNFQGLTAAINLNPAPSTDGSVGAVSAACIGMQQFGGGTTNAPDVVLGKNSDTGANTIANVTLTWRIRGVPGNGWISTAGIGTQGAQFSADTSGFTGIQVGFDWYATTQGEANLQLQYTTDGVNWVNVPITIPASESGSGVVNVDNTGGSDGNSVTGYYVSDNLLNNGSSAGQDWFTNLTASITDPAAANNPLFAIRLVNASTGASCVSTAGTALNNTSGNWRFDNILITGTANGAITPPAITSSSVATVDGPFTNTFTDNSTWRGKITGIKVNGTTLSTSAYVVSSGKIVFTPSLSALLQTSASVNISISATGYSADPVTQYIAPGAAKQLAVTTQPIAPVGNGGTFVTQPVLAVMDQYSNVATNCTATYTASPSSGWGFGFGSGVTQLLTNGTVTFTNLSATNLAAISGATITFTASGATGLGALPSTTTNSSAFNIPAPATTGFTPGNLAVFQEDVASKNSTFSIIELSPSTANQSSPVNTFPITATGTNAMRETSAATTGRLATSDDKTLVCFAAFEDGSSLTADEATVDPRGVGTVNQSGNYVLQTSYVGLGDATGNQARSATSVDNTNWYIGDKGGVYTNNDTSPSISGSGANVRSLKSFGGTVYALQQFSANLARPVLSIVVLTSESQELDDLAGLPQDANVLDFYLISSQNNGTYDTLYYIDGTNSTSGCIFKYYSTDGVNWNLAGSVNTSNGGDGLCAANNPNGGVDLYYTTGNGGAASNSVITVHDSANNASMYANGGQNPGISLGSFTTLYTAAPQATLKGIAFAPVFPPAAPTVSTLTASNITAGSATLDGAANPNNLATACWFIYGTNNTTSLTNITTTNFLSAGYGAVTVTNLIPGLLSATTYYYQIAATNNDGLSLGVTNSFTTAVPPVTAPTVTTLVASNITAGSATFNGTVNPNGGATAYWFRYGTNTSYGIFTATNSTSGAGTVSMIVSNLLQGRVYHYQIVATNSAATSLGADTNFNTLAVTPPQFGSGSAQISFGGSGPFHFSFTNAPGATFTVLGTTNIALPLNQWNNLGTATEVSPGNYQFSDPNATNNPAQFYILRAQ